VSARPEPLAPFVEASAAAADTEALIARFSDELTAVGGHVYRLSADSFDSADELAAG